MRKKDHINEVEKNIYWTFWACRQILLLKINLIKQTPTHFQPLHGEMSCTIPYLFIYLLFYHSRITMNLIH